MNKSAIDMACEAVGGQANLAGKLDVTPQAVNLWVSSGRVPAGRVLAIEAATGVPRHALRPDLYPPETEAAGRTALTSIAAKEAAA